MSKRDYYEILGVSKSVEEGELKKAYRKVAMQYHPDRNPGDKESEEKFKEAAEAYEILSNGDKRARYDRMGHAGVDPNYGGGGGFGGQGMSMDDIYANFGNIFEDSPFGSFFGGGGGGQRRSQGGGQKGSNLRIKIKMTLEEVHSGVKKKIRVNKQVSCQTCGGSGAKDKSSVKTCGTCHGAGAVREVRNTFLGQMQTTSTCPTCNGAGKTVTANCTNCKGDGRVQAEETIEFEIPAGVSDGMQLSMSGKGNAGQRGGPSGDLIITIEELAHEVLERDGNNLLFDLNINIADAAVGASIEVPTIDGKARIKVPPGTQSGKIFRLRGKGLPGLQSYGKGDQLIQVNVWTPQKLSDEEKQLLEKLRTMPNFNPDPNKQEKGFFQRMKEMFND